MVRHSVSIIQMLPADYEQQIEQLPGVVDATPASWFGGIYQDPKNFFGQFPVKPEEYLAMYPEFLLPPEQKAAWLRTRTGAVVGRQIATKYGWKIGDRIPLQATIWRPKTGGETWDFELVGIYDEKEKETDDTQFLFRDDYFEENRTFGQGTIGWYMLRIDDPARARRRGQARSTPPSSTRRRRPRPRPRAPSRRPSPTRWATSALIVTVILAAVFFTILLRRRQHHGAGRCASAPRSSAC